MIAIHSRDNPLVKRIHALSSSGRERRKTGLTVLDGAHLIASALDAGIALTQLVVSESGLARQEHQALIHRIGTQCPVASLPEETARNGGRVVLVTQGPTPWDGRADVKLDNDVEDDLAAVLGAL